MMLFEHFAMAYVGDPSDRPSPQQTGWFGDDQNIAWHQANDAPTFFRHKDPTFWRSERWEGGERRELQPDHELHTTQDHWHSFDEQPHEWSDGTVTGAEGDYYLRHPEDYSQAADDDIPLVARVDGKDWIGHGHHRLMSDRRLGRPTTVWYKDLDAEESQKTSARLDPDKQRDHARLLADHLAEHHPEILTQSPAMHDALHRAAHTEEAKGYGSPRFGQPSMFGTDHDHDPLIDPALPKSQRLAGKDTDEIMSLLGPGVPKAKEKTPEQQQAEDDDRAERIRKHQEWQASRKGYNPGDDLSDWDGYPHAEWVPIEVAQHFREHSGDQHAGSQDTIRDIANQLQAGRGMTDPLMLLHHNEANRASLGEGNHRLAAMERAGWTHVPMRVVRMYDGEAERGKGQEIPYAWRGTHVGRTPELARPSEVLRSSLFTRKNAAYSGEREPEDREGRDRRGGPGLDQSRGRLGRALSRLRRLAADPGQPGEGLRELTWHPKALKEYKRLDKPSKKSIDTTLEGLQRGDANLQTHKLTGPLTGWFSTKASRGHRIVHQTTDSGGIHIGSVSLHDYTEAINRLGGKAWDAWYHASTHPFSEGDTVLPGDQVGRRNFQHVDGPARHSRVYLAPSLEHAEEWARIIGPERWEDTHIYEVRPQGRVKQTGDDESHAPMATVVRRVKTLRAPQEYSRMTSRWTHPFEGDLQRQAATRTVTEADGSNYDGVMIAFVPPRWLAEALVLDEGTESLDNLHVTLAYLGDMSEYTSRQLRMLPEVVAAWAKHQQSLTARTQGAGTFIPADENGKHVVWASVDIPEGHRLHASLVDHLRREGYAPHEDHSWTPHLTLTYSPTEVRFLPKVALHEWQISEIWVCIGGRWESQPLGS